MACALWAGLAQAAPKVEMQLERTAEGAFTNIALQFELSEQIEDALNKGVAVYFVQEAEVIAERWYWRDRRAAKAARYLRLSFQPLTRRWRLHLSSSPFAESGMAMSLGQSFDSLEEVMAVIKRVRHWKIADAAEIAGGSDYLVKFSFRLDMTQLPRPFQIGPFGASGLNLQLNTQLPLPELETP
ncbi:hypothetical protein GCM10027082_31120 [Comamonas humi]